MKVDDFCAKMRECADETPDMIEFITALERFNGLSLSVVTDKIAKMKVPKVDPSAAALELKSLFKSSFEFEQRISEMERDRNYTKAVFEAVFAVLFPNMNPPAKSIRKNDLVDRIRRERRRVENLATA